MGDAAGIGPEVIVKALCTPGIYNICRPVVIGEPDIFSTPPRTWGTKFKYCAINKICEAKFESEIIDCLNMPNGISNRLKISSFSEHTGYAAAMWITEGVKLALSGEIDALVTAPINKEAINLAGFSYQGHTEMLASLTNISKYAMMFTADWLKLVLVTIHVPLKEVPHLLTEEKILNAITLFHQAFILDFGIDTPRIGVCGLNPHASENGLFGDEERRIIQPAIEKAFKMGIRITGAYPPDTIFHETYKGKLDGVVAMYHDQGLIPLKLLSFDSAVNVTLGLPIIRTSPDHGCAFEIAGTGIASSQSMFEAIKLAAYIAKRRNTNNKHH